MRREKASNPDRAAEAIEARAASHRHVLAGVDELPRTWIGEGTGPATEALPRFENRDVEPVRSQSCGCRKACEPATNHDHAVVHNQPHFTGHAERKINPLRQRGTRTRFSNTASGRLAIRSSNKR